MKTEKQKLIFHKKDVEKIMKEYLSKEGYEVSKVKIVIKPCYDDDGTGAKAMDKFDKIVCEVDKIENI